MKIPRPKLHPYVCAAEEYPPEPKPETTSSDTASEPMNTSEEDNSEIHNPAAAPNGIANSEESPTASPVFKRPGDPISFDSPVAKRAKTTPTTTSEEGRPLREIHSVIMTTSGYISPAREGKLPESRTPQQARSDSPTPDVDVVTPVSAAEYPMVPPELKVEKKLKKIPKKPSSAGPEDGVNKPENKENKKKKIPKESMLFTPDQIKDSGKVKKLAGMKEMAKLKALKPGIKAPPIPNLLAGPSNIAVPAKIPGKLPKLRNLWSVL